MFTRPRSRFLFASLSSLLKHFSVNFSCKINFDSRRRRTAEKETLQFVFFLIHRRSQLITYDLMQVLKGVSAMHKTHWRRASQSRTGCQSFKWTPQPKKARVDFKNRSRTARGGLRFAYSTCNVGRGGRVYFGCLFDVPNHCVYLHGLTSGMCDLPRTLDALTIDVPWNTGDQNRCNIHIKEHSS